ncbi:type I-A CRISPR-associated protein Cas7/Csa2 [Desulfurococcus amylolyticus]|uniref:CRISPR-associated autoregulator, Csa2 family n=1 Tax=Desulfurococcus amylolyticus DSM 16532 TaxID=768672 RepID=I3XQW6_DESAM|nr:type I-A CRISPR-associated protein Cas7/Csa2 [Desulfurococcus amylolyticus]AFL66340.1 CRISPR-associated autoregulator, Csa2 family [Desulfurococcus amylolyticus DSM 16532]
MYAPPYVKIAGRVEVQVSALTGYGAIGNYNQHTVARVVVDGNVYEVPVMTGNSLKHWHSFYLAEIYEAHQGKLINEFCKRGVGLRGKELQSTFQDPQPANSECEAILDICNDIHGFLIPDKQIKRDSLVKVSFMIPVLTKENLEIASKFAVQHNRVIPSQVKVSDQDKMMVFKQEYSTALYGFNISMNLGLTLKPQYEPGCNFSKFNLNDERKLRIKSSILAVLALITGGAGSKQARALPITKVKELLAVVSNHPVPNLIHGAYADYHVESLEALKAYAKASVAAGNMSVHVLCHNIREKDVDYCAKEKQSQGQSLIVFESYDSLDEFFRALVEKALKFVE